MDYVSPRLGAIADRQILARADIEVSEFVVVVHEEEAGVGKIVDVKKLAPGSAGTPDFDLSPSFNFRVVELTNQRGQHVGLRQVEVVVRTIEVGRHRENEVRAVLATIGLAQFNAGDLRNRIWLVGRLEQSSEEVLFFHRLWRQPWINARTAKVKEFSGSILMRRVHD